MQEGISLVVGVIIAVGFVVACYFLFFPLMKQERPKEATIEDITRSCVAVYAGVSLERVSLTSRLDDFKPAGQETKIVELIETAFLPIRIEGGIESLKGKTVAEIADYMRWHGARDKN